MREQDVCGVASRQLVFEASSRALPTVRFGDQFERIDVREGVREEICDRRGCTSKCLTSDLDAVECPHAVAERRTVQYSD